MIDNEFLSNLKNDEHLRFFGMSEENIAYAIELAKSNPILPMVDDDLDVIEIAKLLPIVVRYQQILFDKIEDDENFRYVPDDEDQTSDKHLLWMLYQIKFNVDQSLTKKHRWLGFIQGIMTSRGYINVNEERNLTRDILNGS